MLHAENIQRIMPFELLHSPASASLLQSNPFSAVPIRSNDHQETIIVLLDKFLESSSYSFKSPLYKCIYDLAFPLEEDKDEDWPEINISSLEGLIAFFTISSAIPTIRPQVVLTDDGNLRVEWNLANDKFLGIEFVRPGRQRYVLFTPGRDHQSINRESGECDLSKLEHQIGGCTWLKPKDGHQATRLTVIPNKDSFLNLKK